MTALNSPIPLNPIPQHRGGPVDDFVDRLSHASPGRATGPVIAFLQSLFTAGLLPLVIWPTRWAEFLESERHDLLDLAGWWRRRVDSNDAARLDKIVRRLRPRPILMVLPWLAVAFNLVLMITLIAMGDDLARLRDLTFGRVPVGFVNQSPTYEIESRFYLSWVITLGLAYLCHWYAVRSHVLAVNALVKWTNRISRENKFRHIPLDVLQKGWNPLWIVLAIGLCLMNAWWAIPMVLAGSLQRMYCRKTSPTVRMALASQARSAFAIARSHRDRFCAAGHCGARLPAPAKFCPRCGTAV
jgi:hypothetical protein